MPSFDITIEIEESDILILTMGVSIEYDFQAGESQTWDYPGSDSFVEFVSAYVTELIGSTSSVKRNESNESIFKSLDEKARVLVEENWEEDYEDQAFDNQGDYEESILADRYED